MFRIKFVADPGELSADDAQTIRVLQEQVFGEVYTSIKDMPDAYWWLAVEGRKPIGFCSMTPYKELGCMFLSLAGVVPGFRGHGLQRRMIRAREKKGKTVEWVKRFVSYTSNDNIWSANNLIRCGYLLYTPPHEWGIKDAYYFQKKIK